MAETPIAATYISASSFSVASDKVSEFPAGVRVLADCGADGYQQGVSTGYTGTTIGLTMDAGDALTANLMGVWHSNDTPDSLVNHGHTGQADGGDLPGFILADNSRPFTEGHIRGQGPYTGFFFTETDAPTDEKKCIYQVDNSQASLILVNDAETTYETAWVVNRTGATPTDMTVTPLLIAAGGINADTFNGEDVSGGVVTKSILAAPGDIIVASAPNTPSRLGIGSVGSPLVVGPSGLPVYAQRGPGCYFRDTRFAAKTVTVAADRYIILSPNRMLVDISGIAAELTTQQSLNLSLTATWDSVTTDYRVAANRAGKDFYVYAVLVGGIALGLLVSANATYPTGYSATTSRKVGGFHCLCLSVGTISGHVLTGYVTGDILPASVWDLKHRPVSSPEGMVYVSGLGKWVDIYLSSVSAGAMASAYGATCADGASSPAFHWYKFSQWLATVGKRLLTQAEFVAASLGSNQGTNIAGSADPVTTGGKSDTGGRRMISNVGCEDCCGNLWQWGEEAGGGASSAAWVNAFDGNDSGVAGQHYLAPNRAILGGSWANGANCGSRCSAWLYGPLSLYESIGARGVAEPLAVGI